jgi:hypothetical protein
MVYFQAVKMAETSHAAERTAAMLKTIPGALRGPKIASIATNATAAMVKREVCMVLCGLVLVVAAAIHREYMKRR